MKTSSRDVIRQVTVRLPEREYARASQLARARRVSFNALVRQLLEDLDRSERERVLSEAYDRLGREGAEVDQQFEAQAEVARRG